MSEFPGYGPEESALDTTDIDENAAQVAWETQDKARAQAEAAIKRKADEEGEPDTLEAPPFEALGFDRKAHFIYSSEQGQVLPFSVRDFTNLAELLSLARESWWEKAFPPTPKQTGAFNVSRAANYLIRQSQSKGVYHRGKLRGRGVWMDEGQVVVHLGDRLIVDGVETDLNKFQSVWRYERAGRILVNTNAKPATFEQCRLLIDACAGIAFTNPERDPRILAGWLLIAFLAGLLPWRPHLWITSEAGEGKTFVAENLVGPLLGEIAEAIASKSTEPGIRRLIKNDGRPVSFDEAEGDTPAAQARAQLIQELMRQASSQSSAQVVQAGAGSSDEVVSVRPNFIGILFSVHLTLTQPADISRFVTMSLRTATPEEMQESERRLAALFTPGISDRFFMLALDRVPQILANHRVLRDAIARYGNRRAGDTLGMILAGYQALLHDRVLTAAEAVEMVKGAPWLQEAAHEQVPQKEWQRLLGFIAQQRFRHHNSPGSLATDMSVGEACSLLGHELYAETQIVRELLIRSLGQQGIKVEATPAGGHVVYIGNTSVQMEKWLHGKPWAQSWRATLLRAPGVTRSPKAVYFKGTGASDRATIIPLRVLLGMDDPTIKEGEP